MMNTKDLNEDSKEDNSMDMEIENSEEELIKNSNGMVASTMESLGASNSFQSSIGNLYDHFSSFLEFKNLINVTSNSITEQMKQILSLQGVTINFEGASFEEQLEMLRNYNDDALEKARIMLDESDNCKVMEQELEDNLLPKVSTTISTSWNRKIYGDKTISTPVKFVGGMNVVRPQNLFKWSIDNSDSPFVPMIREKPNSIKPLALLLEQTEFGEEYSHPYEVEIEAFKPTEIALKISTPLKPSPSSDVPLEFIDTPEALDVLVKELKNCSELAVDLEHHSFRTYMGITCLMQLSTRNKDYIIDTLKLRNDLEILNEVFTDPKIIKVFHGADMDIEWLQRDLALYVVNMFDTGQASRVLEYPHHSLSYLVKTFCEVELDKSQQQADWRIRPLTEEMIKYAREDTHSLLYIYDLMRNELLNKSNSSKNLLKAVYQRSKNICLKRYRKPQTSSETYFKLYRNSFRTFNGKQMEAFKNLYLWRDKIARENDESTGYVLPNHMVLAIAQNLPREQQGILACCNPVPTMVKNYQHDIHMIVHKARNMSTEEISQVIEPVLKTMKQDQRRILNPEISTMHYPSGCITYKEMKCNFNRVDIEEKLGKMSLFNNIPKENIPELEYISPWEKYSNAIQVEKDIESLLEEAKSKAILPTKRKLEILTTQVDSIEPPPKKQDTTPTKKEDYLTKPNSNFKKSKGNKKKNDNNRINLDNFKPFDYSQQAAAAQSSSSIGPMHTPKSHSRNFEPYRPRGKSSGPKKKNNRNQSSGGKHQGAPSWQKK